MSRLPRATHWSRQSTKRRGYAILGAAFAMAACVHAPARRPSNLVSYWEALAELRPAEAAAAARTESERKFAEALESLMAGDLDKAENGFGELRRTATDSILRSGSRVIYTATLQYQEKWNALAALRNDASEPKGDRT